MLVLSRKESEVINIGDDIKLKVTRIRGGRVMIGVDAPKEFRILRGELKEHKAAKGETHGDE